MRRPLSASPTDHCDGRRFFNPNGANGQPFWMVPRMLLTPRTPWPSAVSVEPRRPPTAGPVDVVVTFVGHATFLIQVASTTLLTDPVFAERASPVSSAGPRRVRAPGVRFDDLPAISLVLLSHNRYDHCDLGTLRALDRRFQPRLVALIGNGRLLRSAGIRQVEEIDWWQSAGAAPLRVTLTPVRSRPTPHRRLRAALVDEGHTHESGGSRTGAPRSRSAPEHRDPFRHVSIDAGGNRRTGSRIGEGVAGARCPGGAVSDGGRRGVGVSAPRRTRTPSGLNRSQRKGSSVASGCLRLARRAAISPREGVWG